MDAMKNGDFSNARFRMSAFRRYNFCENDGTVWPDDEDQIVVNRYGRVLERTIALIPRDDLSARVVHVLLESKLKWIGPSQEVGLFSLLDYVDRPAAQDLLRRTLSQAVRPSAARVVNGNLAV